MFLLAFSRTDSLWVAATLLFAVGGLLTAFAVAATTLVQSSVVNAYRGRVIAITLALYIGTPALGAFVLGWFAEIAGFQNAVATGAAFVVIVINRFVPACTPAGRAIASVSRPRRSAKARPYPSSTSISSVARLKTRWVQRRARHRRDRIDQVLHSC